MNMIVRRDKEKYMQDLKKWLIENSDSELEEMERFFEKRIDGYEEHMAV